MLLSVPGYGRKTITSLPFTISVPGTYVSGNNFDLTYPRSSGNAITVNASNVDLDGYYLYCSASTGGVGKRVTVALDLCEQREKPVMRKSLYPP